MATTQRLRSPADPIPDWETPSARSLRGAFRILASYTRKSSHVDRLIVQLTARMRCFFGNATPGTALRNAEIR
jgi:hypothetical protein